MIALYNNLANIGIPPVDITLMVPVFTSVADYGAKTVTVTSASTVSGTETFKHANIIITDNQGKSVYGAITTISGNTGAISVSGLQQTGDLIIKVVAVSTLGIIAVGRVATSATALSVTVGDYETSFTTCNGQ